MPTQPYMWPLTLVALPLTAVLLSEAGAAPAATPAPGVAPEAAAAPGAAPGPSAAPQTRRRQAGASLQPGPPPGPDPAPGPARAPQPRTNSLAPDPGPSPDRAPAPLPRTANTKILSEREAWTGWLFLWGGHLLHNLHYKEPPPVVKMSQLWFLLPVIQFLCRVNVMMPAFGLPRPLISAAQWIVCWEAEDVSAFSFTFFSC